MNSIESIFRKKRDWQEHLNELTKLLLSTSSENESLQGELVRCIQILRVEARNEWGDWHRGHEDAVKILKRFLRDRKTFQSDKEVRRIKVSLDKILFAGTVNPDEEAHVELEFIATKVVAWCKAHTQLIHKSHEQTWLTYVFFRGTDPLPDPRNLIEDREDLVLLKGPCEKAFCMNLHEGCIQTESDTSFIGGKPRIPRDVEIPKCQLCKQEMAFYFQVAFPFKNAWNGYTLAVFSCVSCFDENHLIPELFLSSAGLKGAIITSENLDTYQKNFRILTFPTVQGVTRTTYQEKVVFYGIEFRDCEPDFDCHRVGGYPSWSMGDEAPGSLVNEPPIFLFQIRNDLQFQILSSAPAQARIDFGMQRYERNYYDLFWGNGLFFFGTKEPSENRVYMVLQSD